MSPLGQTAPYPRRIFGPMTLSPTLTGILLAILGTIIFSVNDMAIKFLSGGYALHQVVLIRALVGMSVMVGFLLLTGRGLGVLRTRRLRGHLLRTVIVILSNVCFFLGLAAMPIADALAVGYVGPIVITFLSAVALRETVGPRRWAAVIVGMIGVLVMLRPGAGVVEPGALLVLISAVFYAIGNLMVRHMGQTENSFAFSFYVQTGFILVSLAMGLWAGDGHLASDDPLWGFLFRPWVVPSLYDAGIMAISGVAVFSGGFMLAQAYRSTEAGLVAPFEYVGMPMGIFWGVVVFGTWPDTVAWAGIALICGAGLYTMWREGVRRKAVTGPVAIKGQ
jgi:drug/metabolite transporter (DMT)-like permease